MSTKREELLARWRARSLERLRAVSLALIELEAGRAGEPQVKTLARDLHTLKGDARVVGQGSLSEIFHRIEDAVLAQGTAGAAPALSRVRAALEATGEVLTQALEGTAADDVLRLAALALGEQPAVPGPAATRPPSPSTPAEPRAAPRANGRFRLIDTARVDAASDQVLELAASLRAVLAELRVADAGGALLEKVDRAASHLDEVVASTWALRLVPVAPLLEDLVGPATALAGSLGKRVRVVIEAAGCEVERAVLDDLHEPLLHLVRNAVDHGLEAPEQRGEKPPEGLLTLRASVQGPSLAVEVCDDGRGIDLARVRARAVELALATDGQALSRDECLELLFHHGFSTRTVADDVSGRGVGLDVVRSAVDAVNGQVTISATGPLGTTFTLSVPTALSRERALVFVAGGQTFGLPALAVDALVRLDQAQVERVAGGLALAGARRAALVSLLGVLGGTASSTERWALVLASRGGRLAFSVDEVLGEREVLRRPLDPLLAKSAFLSGSATLDDGRLVLLLSAAALVRGHGQGAGLAGAEGPRTRAKVLVVDDSLTVCNLMHELLEDAGFDVTEAHDGLEALDALAAGTPDLVVTDIDMPRMDGFALLDRLRSRHPHLPVVVLSMRGSPDDQREAAARGANAYLVKSRFDEGTLADTVRRLLGGAR